MLYGVSEKIVSCFQVYERCWRTLNNGFHPVSAELQVDFAAPVFKFDERVYNFELILFHPHERRNIEGITKIVNQIFNVNQQVM